MNGILTFELTYDNKLRYRASITTIGENEFQLRWETQFQGPWIEAFDSLAVAIARLATLQHCEEMDWCAGFTTRTEEFRQQTGRFFDQTTSWDDEQFVGWQEVTR